MVGVTGGCLGGSGFCVTGTLLTTTREPESAGPDVDGGGGFALAV